MCRFMVFAAQESVPIAGLLTRPSHSIVKQSYGSKEMVSGHILHGDGFGIGWYAPETTSDTPCVFTCCMPAWNNRNLHRLAEKIVSQLLFAHVRAATTGALSDDNCHPFSHGRLLFMHNGSVASFNMAVRRQLLASLHDSLFESIKGTTDSEHMFALVLNQFPPGFDFHSEVISPLDLLCAIVAAITKINEWEAAAGISEVCYLNLAISNGETVVASRYASSCGVTCQSANASLYLCTGSSVHAPAVNEPSECRMVHHGLRPAVVLIASEPLWDRSEWKQIPHASVLVVPPSKDVLIFPFDDVVTALHSRDTREAFFKQVPTLLQPPTPSHHPSQRVPLIPPHEPTYLRPVHVLREGLGVVTVVMCWSEYNVLVVGLASGTLVVVSLETFRVLVSEQAHRKAICSIVVVGGVLVTASTDATIRLWRHGLSPPLASHKSRGSSLASSATGPLPSPSLSSSLSLASPITGAPTVGAHQGGGHGLTFEPISPPAPSFRRPLPVGSDGRGGASQEKGLFRERSEGSESGLHTGLGGSGGGTESAVVREGTSSLTPGGSGGGDGGVTSSETFATDGISSSSSSSSSSSNSGVSGEGSSNRGTNGHDGRISRTRPPTTTVNATASVIISSSSAGTQGMMREGKVESGLDDRAGGLASKRRLEREADTMEPSEAVGPIAVPSYVPFDSKQSGSSPLRNIPSSPMTKASGGATSRSSSSSISGASSFSSSPVATASPSLSSPSSSSSSSHSGSPASSSSSSSSSSLMTGSARVTTTTTTRLTTTTTTSGPGGPGSTGSSSSSSSLITPSYRDSLTSCAACQCDASPLLSPSLPSLFSSTTSSSLSSASTASSPQPSSASAGSGSTPVPPPVPASFSTSMTATVTRSTTSVSIGPSRVLVNGEGVRGASECHEDTKSSLGLERVHQGKRTPLTAASGLGHACGHIHGSSQQPLASNGVSDVLSSGVLRASTTSDSSQGTSGGGGSSAAVSGRREDGAWSLALIGTLKGRNGDSFLLHAGEGEHSNVLLIAQGWGVPLQSLALTPELLEDALLAHHHSVDTSESTRLPHQHQHHHHHSNSSNGSSSSSSHVDSQPHVSSASTAVATADPSLSSSSGGGGGPGGGGAKSLSRCLSLEGRVRTFAAEVPVHRGRVYDLHVASGRAYTGTGEGCIFVWDLPTHSLVVVLTSHTAAVTALAASARLGVLFSGSADGVVKTWDITLPTPYCVRSNNSLGLSAGSVCAIKGTDTGFVTGHSSGAVCVWNGSQLQECLGAKIIHSSAVAALAVVDSQPSHTSASCPLLIVTGGADRILHIASVYSARRTTVTTPAPDAFPRSGTGLLSSFSSPAQPVPGSASALYMSGYMGASASGGQSWSARGSASGSSLSSPTLLPLPPPPPPPPLPLSTRAPLVSLGPRMPTLADPLMDVLGSFVEIRSVSVGTAETTRNISGCIDAARLMCGLLEQLGADVRVLCGEDGCNPLVVGYLSVPSATSTVVLYGHYDVQPANESGWLTDPFDLTARDGYLYGRGVSDNKGPLVAMVFAVKELLESGQLASNIVFCVEGEEEVGSPGFQTAVGNSLDWFRDASLVIICNTHWLGDHTPCLNYGLRGSIQTKITVSGPARNLHAGVDGGAVHEPYSDLVHILSNLVTHDGTALIKGFYDSVRALTPEEASLYERLDFDVQAYAEEIGNPNLAFASPRDLLFRRWREPTISIHSIEASAGTMCTIIPAAATAVVSMRIVPDQAVDTIQSLFLDTVTEVFSQLQSPNKLNVEVVSAAPWWLARRDHPSYVHLTEILTQVWGVPPLEVREGGTIPLTSFLESVTGAAVLHLPLSQGSDCAHLPNERMSLENFLKGKDVLKRLLAIPHQKGSGTSSAPGSASGPSSEGAVERKRTSEQASSVESLSGFDETLPPAHTDVEMSVEPPTKYARLD